MSNLFPIRFTSLLVAFIFAINLQADECAPQDDISCHSSSQKIEVDTEFLYWELEDSPRPIPLVAQGPTYAPVLGQLNTSIVLGNANVHTHWRSGGKFSLGYWFDECRTFGLNANYFFLPKIANTKTTSSTGYPGSTYLGTPFDNVLNATASSNPIANLNPFIDGGAYANQSQFKLENSMQNAELNGVMSFSWHDTSWHFGFLSGFRYWNFNEKVTFTTNSPYIAIPSSVFRTIDLFNVQNNFYGGQVGLDAIYKSQYFFFGLKTRIAFGANCAKTHILGKTVSNDFNSQMGVGPTQEYAGGIYALSTNSGMHKKTVFTAIPEVNLTIGGNITNYFSVRLGYSFIYISKMLWATEQINSALNPTQSVAIMGAAPVQLQGLSRPTPLNSTNSMYLQGVNIGFDLEF